MVGCGFIGRVHSWAYWALRKANLFDAAITAVCDRDPRRAADLAKPHDAEVLSLDALIGSVDVVYVCTPTVEHVAVCEAAADRGLAVFCEKPLARDLAGAERVARALKRVPHRVGLVLRAAPVFSALREIISSGRYGRPMALTLHDDQYFPIQGQYASTWRSDHAIAGGGTLIEHSIHDVDLFRWLLGEPASVSCRTASFFGHPGIEDLAVATFDFDGGSVASLTSVWHQVTTRGSTRRVEVFFEQAHLWTQDDNTGPLHVENSSGTEVIECPPPAWVDDLEVPEQFRRTLGLYTEANRRFLEAVASGSTGSPDATDAVAAHLLVDAAYRSATEGGRLTVV
ncbi:MAG: Gfo/Idh/MocA family oxidoreductase [Actinomycetota bacterium]